MVWARFLQGVAAPIYGSLVDMTGSYYMPNIITLGLGVLTIVILALFMNETYGITVKE